MATESGLDARTLTNVGDVPPGRRPIPTREDFLARMAREGYRFGFFQAVRLIEQRFGEEVLRVESNGGGAGRISFRPDASVAFPPTDVRQVEIEDGEQERARLTLTFMGLYGVDAPLPDFIPEKVLADAASDGNLRDFLDIFSHRIYTFFYQAWKRVRPEVDGAMRHERRYLALGGLAASADEQTRERALAMLPYVGLLAPRARGAAGLTVLLKSLFDLPVHIEENVPRWVRLGYRGTVGRGFRLEASSFLGERVLDVSGKFRIWIGPMNLDRFRSLLPGGEGAARLQRIVRTYIPGNLDYDVALQLRTEEMPRARLADPATQLGLTACLGRPLAPIITRMVAVDTGARRAQAHQPPKAA